MAVKTYDPKQIHVLIGGVAMGGFTDGTFVKVARDEDSFTKKVGVDGETSRVRTNNNGGTLMLTLHQTSPSNDVLSAFVEADELGNEGIVPVLIKDGTGRTELFSALAWVKKPADATFGKDVENREWTLELTDVKVFSGGTPSFSPAT